MTPAECVFLVPGSWCVTAPTAMVRYLVCTEVNVDDWNIAVTIIILNMRFVICAGGNKMRLRRSIRHVRRSEDLVD